MLLMMFTLPWRLLLSMGDLMVVNVGSEFPGKPSCRTEIFWVGAATIKAATNAQAAKHKSRKTR